MAFNVRKAAQTSAFFARKEGGSINVLKLAKLLYLSDRAFMEKYDRPILYDWFVSMDHGPVDSATLNYINGLAESEDWDAFIADRAHYSVGLSRRNIDVSDLDELSDAELDVLVGVWKKFGRMNQYQIRDYTHLNCPEWEDPHGTSMTIPYERVFKFLGKKHSDELARQVEESRRVDRILTKFSELHA